MYPGCSPSVPNTASRSWGLRARSSPLGSPAWASCAPALPLNNPNPVVFSSSKLGNNERPCAGPGCLSPSLQLARPPVLSSSEQDQLKPSFPFTLFKGLPIHWGRYRLHETFGSQWAVCAARQRGLFQQRAVILGAEKLAPVLVYNSFTHTEKYNGDRSCTMTG